MNTIEKKIDAIIEAASWASKVRVYFDLKDFYREREANKTVGILSLLSIKVISDETTDIDLEADGDTLDWPRQEETEHFREFVFQCRFQSRSSQYASSAWYSALNLQNRLNTKYPKERWFFPNGWGFFEFTDLTRVPGGQLFDDRVEEVGVVGFSLCATLTERDSANIGTFFEKFGVTVTLENMLGTSLGPKLQINEVL